MRARIEPLTHRRGGELICVGGVTGWGGKFYTRCYELNLATNVVAEEKDTRRNKRGFITVRKSERKGKMSKLLLSP